MQDKQQNKTKLHIDWCSYEAAKYAVMNWHYSKTMPVNKIVKIGVWENDTFIGAVIFGLGSGNATNGKSYGLQTGQMAELVRVALNKHHTQVSKIISIAIKMLKKQSPKLRLLISFADTGEHHHGGIYQAGNWIYTGTANSGKGKMFIIHGELTHPRSLAHKNLPQTIIGAKKLDINATETTCTIKHRYLYPLDDDMRKRIEPLRKPYPKRTPDSGAVANNGRQCEPDPSAPIIQDEEAT